MSDLEEYIKDEYGICTLGRFCDCLKPNVPWLGRACNNWIPAPVKDWEELAVYARSTFYAPAHGPNAPCGGKTTR